MSIHSGTRDAAISDNLYCNTPGARHPLRNAEITNAMEHTMVALAQKINRFRRRIIPRLATASSKDAPHSGHCVRVSRNRTSYPQWPQNRLGDSTCIARAWLNLRVPRLDYSRLAQTRGGFVRHFWSVGWALPTMGWSAGLAMRKPPDGGPCPPYILDPFPSREDSDGPHSGPYDWVVMPDSPARGWNTGCRSGAALIKRFPLAPASASRCRRW
jgi:hypothetical protein